MYKIENTNSRTIMDLTGSASFLSYWTSAAEFIPYHAGNPANGTPIIGYASNGSMNRTR